MMVQVRIRRKRYFYEIDRLGRRASLSSGS